MLLRLSDMDPMPLRDQIVARVREAVLSGELGEHEPLPSIRGLAREQRVGVVTVQRAFEDLEREGIIYARQGKGYYAAPLDEETRRQQARERVRRALAPVVREALALGLTREDLLEELEQALRDAPGEKR